MFPFAPRGRSSQNPGHGVLEINRYSSGAAALAEAGGQFTDSAKKVSTQSGLAAAHTRLPINRPRLLRL